MTIIRLLLVTYICKIVNLAHPFFLFEWGKSLVLITNLLIFCQCNIFSQLVQRVNWTGPLVDSQFNRSNRLVRFKFLFIISKK